MVLLAKWLVYCLILRFLTESPGLQITLIYFLCMLNQTLILKFKPYALPADNYIALINELLASSYLIGLISLSEYNKNEDVKPKASFGLLITAFLSFALNMLYALWQVCVHIKVRLLRIIKAKIHSKQLAAARKE